VRDMEGRVALVTGGSSGIGLATARAFAARGASVVIAARGHERGEVALESIRALGAAAEFVATDVSQEAQVEALVAHTVDRFGRLDFAFNNAASAEVGVFKATADFSLDEWQQAMAFDLTSVWLCMKCEITQMLRQGTGGAIVNTSSVNGLGGVRGASPYAAAKAGVIALTKSAAMEYAPNGIRVNTLVPGAFETPMLRSAINAHAKGDPQVVAATEAVYTRLTPLGRIGRPEEAAEAVLWLCSGSSSFITGFSLIADGGMTAWAR
jgi:NAD(P)-dependent dehydrogenase (short-subunit alcohol dehydrogenase family)